MPPLNKFTRTCLALAISQAVIAPVNAANIIVNTSDDNIIVDGDCTLREAIISAKNDEGTSLGCDDGSGADTITFDSVGPTISLTYAPGHLLINSDVTISGPGSSNLSIDGSNLSRVFYIISGVVDINGLTISGGSSSDSGGGIRASNTQLTIENSVIENNTADVRGGGLYLSGLTNVNIINSVISGNSAGTGAGFYHKNGSLNISNSTIRDNLTVSGSGGGAYVRNAIIDITGSTIENNFAQSNGGGLQAYTTNEIVISNSTISGNTSTFRAGGILIADNSTLSLYNSTVVENTTAYGTPATFNGGGIRSYTAVVLNITNSIISGNASSAGEEIHASGTTATFTNSIFGDDQNTYAQAFYGVTFDSSSLVGSSDKLNIDFSTIVNSLSGNGGPTQTHSLPLNSPAIDAGVSCNATPVNNLDQRGETRDSNCDIGATERVTKSVVVDSVLDTTGDGAICTLRDAIKSSNTNSAVGYCDAGGDSTLITFDSTVFPASASNKIDLDSILPEITADTTFTGQGDSGLTIDVHDYGSVISVYQATVSFDSVNFNGGSGTSNNGGGLIAYSADVSLNNCIVSENSVTGKGAGIFAKDSSLTINNCIIEDNTSGPQGGGVYTDDTYLMVSNSTFSNNAASVGGAFYLASSPSTVSNTNITSNSATVSGAGIYANTSQLTIENSTLSKNSANFLGGGIHLYSGNTVTIVNSTLSGNSARRNGGGIHVTNNSSLSIYNSTIVDNETYLGANYLNYFGGGIVVSGTAELNIQNTIVSGNSSTGSAEIKSFFGPTITLSNNVFGDDRYDYAKAFDGVTIDGTNFIATSDELNIPLDSILKPLDDNGGPTQTHALSENSPAVDAGNNSDCGEGLTITTDQRGELRDDGACDIGAFEGFIEDPSFYVVPLPGGRSVIFSL